MDAMSIVMPILVVALIALVVALVFFTLKLMKTLQAANDTIAQLEPTLKNVETITNDIQPTIRKIEPIVDRVQLTLDSVNLEMMRVDGILEDVSQITGNAASASSAVDSIASAPVKAVTGVANRVRERFGSKSASEESTHLGDQRAAVEQALDDYKAADAAEAEEAGQNGYTEIDDDAQAGEASTAAEKPYSVIDPEAIENSPFFQDKVDGE